MRPTAVSGRGRVRKFQERMHFSQSSNPFAPPSCAPVHGALHHRLVMTPASYFACSLALHLIVTYWEKDLILATARSVSVLP